MNVKLAYQLSHSILFPGPIERQSTRHSRSIFSESTYQALVYYGISKGRRDFLETAQFIKIVLDWWQTVNAKVKPVSGVSKNFGLGIAIENLEEKQAF